jgi:hypothetical protein
MELASAILRWTYQAIATWYAAALLGGLLIFAADRATRRPEPSAADVRRAAERYRRFYGDAALAAIGDHLLAASFAPDSRHRRFLKRVVEELQADAISDADRANAIEHTAPLFVRDQRFESARTPNQSRVNMWGKK